MLRTELFPKHMLKAELSTSTSHDLKLFLGFVYNRGLFIPGLPLPLVELGASINVFQIIVTI